MKTKLTQPLVVRPAYGEVAESGLPSGGPSDKGLPIDSGIPGSATYAKPSEEDARDFDAPKDEPIYRTDNADDLLVDRERVDTREENKNRPNGIGYGGLGESSTSKTKYPYRDGIPNTKSASAELVVGLWELSQVPERHFPGGVIKVALRLGPIAEGLNPKYIERAQKCSVSTRRTDTKNLRWFFSVNCGNGPKVVKIKAFRKGNITKISKMDLDVKCSCPAWRWQGPEYHAKTEEYIDGKPRGTASVPVVRDPTGINRVCKHVASVLAHIQKWEIPSPKKKK